MTTATDPRTLIAMARGSYARTGQVMTADALDLADGCERALDEVDRLRKQWEWEAGNRGECLLEIDWLRSLIDCLETELTGARNAADRLEAKRTEALAEMERLRSENTELEEQRSSYRDRAQQLAGDVAGLRGEALGRRENPLTCTVARPGELTRECDATKPCAPCRISAGIAHLRAELGEAKLVIEQQDRDLERLRALLADRRTPMNEDRIDAILEGAPCTDATKTK
jgi:FtsZ-binding cell division protein ZapB